MRKRKSTGFIQKDYAAVFFLAAVSAAAASTYAWFTSNRTVDTSRVQARSGTQELELCIGTSQNGAFTAAYAVAIPQVNQADREKLMPVSTADLSSFVCNEVTFDDMASVFVPVENEQYIYHGRIYLKAQAQGQPSDARVALYLDEGSESGGNLASGLTGDMLTAARLGLVFDQDYTHSVIFELSDQENSAGRVRNTVVNGQTLGDREVLKLVGDRVQAVADPCVSLASRTITLNSSRGVSAQEPLLKMELNHVYAVDVYFYIEGCDPDCTDSIAYSTAELHLAFYGVLTQGG